MMMTPHHHLCRFPPSVSASIDDDDDADADLDPNMNDDDMKKKKQKKKKKKKVAQWPVAAPQCGTRLTGLTFDLLPTSVQASRFGPRVGRLMLVRGGRPSTSTSVATSVATKTTTNVINDTSSGVMMMMNTPDIIVGTSRGVVPHFSRDHTNGSDAIRWINVPFESFLEQVPPVPTLQSGPQPLHRFLGFDEDRHIASLCLRDPLDMREMPPNGNTHVSANCVRGVKKVSLSDWRRYVYKMQPDVVFALTDAPLTPLPHSQKRITKSIERSTTWLADMLRPLPCNPDTRPLEPPGSEPSEPPASAPGLLAPSRGHPLNVFVHMAGGTSIPAREAFAHALSETLHGPDADAVEPLRCLDEGVAGYAFDLALLRGLKPCPNTSQHQSMPDGFLRVGCPDRLRHPEIITEVSTPSTTTSTTTTTTTTGEEGVPMVSGLSSASSALSMSDLTADPPPDIASLLKASLGQLSTHKPRLATGVRSPHEMLRLIRDVGIDLFDVGWAMHAAHLGVALDFSFPVRAALASQLDSEAGAPMRLVGHNLYDPVYARQFASLADTFAGAGEGADGDVCLCIACSPRAPSVHILHSAVDRESYTATDAEAVRYEKPYTRAYIHHLLHTHEMSAHTLLVGHNLAVVSAFLAGVREVLGECGDESGKMRFGLEMERFNDVYDQSGALIVDARKDWEYVDRTRGKGRLARERERQMNDQGGV